MNLANKHFDPSKGADLYHMYLDLWCAADEMGLEIMNNEHHQTATCMVPAAPIMLGILALLWAGFVHAIARHEEVAASASQTVRRCHGWAFFLLMSALGMVAVHLWSA